MEFWNFKFATKVKTWLRPFLKKIVQLKFH